MNKLLEHDEKRQRFELQMKPASTDNSLSSGRLYF